MSSASDDGAEFSVLGEMMGLQPYQFEPAGIDIKNACDNSGEESGEEDERRLENLEW